MTHHSDLNFLEDLFLHTASLCLWRFSPSFELEYSNSLTVAPLEKYFHIKFQLSIHAGAFFRKKHSCLSI